MDASPQRQSDAAASEEGWARSTLSLIRRLIQRAQRDSRRLETDYDVTAPQLACLAVIQRDEPVIAARLAREVSLRASTIAGILRRLEVKRFIRRRRDGNDHRRLRIRTTPRGRELLEKVPHPLDQQLARIGRELAPAERREITRSLRRLTDALDAPTPRQ